MCRVLVQSEVGVGLRSAALWAGVSLAISVPVQAQTLINELTYFLTSSAFQPGSVVSSTLTVATNPGIALGAFAFTLTWDTAGATPLATGPGSLAAWGESLSTRGQLTLDPVQGLQATGRWRANALAPSADVIPIGYDSPFQAVFSFQTDASLAVPFQISFDMTGVEDGSGQWVDIGSGWINWATLSPVPEPATPALWLAGLAALAGWAGRARPSTRA